MVLKQVNNIAAWTNEWLLGVKGLEKRNPEDQFLLPAETQQSKIWHAW